MKLNNHILSALAPALLLCAATIGMAGCSQGEDALGATGTVARGGEPIHMSIAPKPGFTDGSSPGTRATVGDDGSFGWVVEKDYIYMYITFNDAAATKYINTWGYSPGVNIYYPYMTDWIPRQGWPADGLNMDASEVSWPLGASRATVQAFYTDVPRSAVGGTTVNPTSLTMDYTAGGTGDHMIYEETLTLGEELVVDFRHTTTRLVLNGLKASTAYSLKAGGAALTFPTVLTVAGFSLATPAEQTFTSDANGKLVVCAALDGKINAGTHKVSLEVMEGSAPGTSAGIVELTAQGSDADGWKMDGYMYTVNFVNGGSIDPDSKPDLLAPAPIVTGNKVYAVNGYYVTAPDADVSKEYQWASSTSATQMDSDPCAGHGDWRMPTMKDFETMAGWTTTNPWSPDGTNTSTAAIASDKDAWNAAFPIGLYWSSVARTFDSNAWLMRSVGYGTASHYWGYKTTSFYVRCVQVQ